MEARAPEPASDGLDARIIVHEQVVQEAIEALGKGTQDENGLGDDEQRSRNLLASDAAEALSCIVASSQHALKLAVDTGAIEAAVRALRQRPNSEIVQRKASRCLGDIASNYGLEGQRLVAEAGGVEAVISALTGHPNSVSVQEHALEALGRLVDAWTPGKLNAQSAGGVDAVILALVIHSESEAVLSQASFTLTTLVCFSEECQLAAVRAGAIGVVITSLRQHLASEIVQERCLQALGHLVTGNAEHQLEALRGGAFTAVFATLQRHCRRGLLQAAALATLGNLVAGCSEAQGLAREAGAIEAVAGALDAFSSEQTVQEHACKSLGHLTANNPSNQTYAENRGLIRQLVQILQRRSGEAAKADAMDALGCLVAGHYANQRSAGEAGAIQAALSVLKDHPDNDRLQESAVLALGPLIASNIDNQVLARESGALLSVLAMIWRPQSRESLQIGALSALTDFVGNCYENTKAAVELGAIEEVLSALKYRAGCELDGDETPSSPGGSPKSPQAGELRKLAREAGLIQAAVGALNTSPKRTQEGAEYRRSAAASRTRILGILGVLVHEDLENQLAAGDHGLVEQVISVLKTREKTEDMRLQALRALLSMLANCAANQRRAKAAGAEQALREMLRQYRTDSFVQEATSLALAALRSGEAFIAGGILRTDFGARLQKHVSIPDVAMRGMTLDQFQEFADYIRHNLAKYDIVDTSPHSDTRGLGLVWDAINMYQVKDAFILPLTTVNQCSYVESVAEGQQPPMWMVSHWWGTPVAYTVRMLMLQARSRCQLRTGAMAYWCCTMANNQHNLSDLEEVDVFKSPFARAMLSQQCMGTVLLCDPAVTPLKRIWCVFEAHITQQLRFGMLSARVDKQFFLDIVAPGDRQDSKGRPVDEVAMAMLQDATVGSWQEVSDRQGILFPLHVAEIGVKVDLCKAIASVERDRLTILNFVAFEKASQEPPPETHSNYDKLNTFVHTVFASAELYRLASERPEGCVEAVAEMLKLRADVNGFLREGNTALLAAVGADSSVKPLTCFRTQRELVSLLLDARADANQANIHKKTAIECGRMHMDIRTLLRENGALTYAEAVPELERSTNNHLVRLLVAGFSTEWQAFQGGDAGTKLTGAAQRSLQAAAMSVLKRYPWASCRVSIQATSKRQATLASDREESVRRELQAVHCANEFRFCQGAQSAILCMTVMLEPHARQRSGGQHSPSPKASAVTLDECGTPLCRSASEARMLPHARSRPALPFLSKSRTTLFDQGASNESTPLSRRRTRALTLPDAQDAPCSPAQRRSCDLSSGGSLDSCSQLGLHSDSSSEVAGGAARMRSSSSCSQRSGLMQFPPMTPPQGSRRRPYGGDSRAVLSLSSTNLARSIGVEVKNVETRAVGRQVKDVETRAVGRQVPMLSTPLRNQQLPNKSFSVSDLNSAGR